MDDLKVQRVLAEPSRFGSTALSEARDALFDLAEQDSEAGRAAQAGRDKLTQALNGRQDAVRRKKPAGGSGG